MKMAEIFTVLFKFPHIYRTCRILGSESVNSSCTARARFRAEFCRTPLTRLSSEIGVTGHWRVSVMLDFVLVQMVKD